MITVKLYGLLRIDSGIKEQVLEATCMQDVLANLKEQGISQKDLHSCILLINGKPATKRSTLHHGDVVQLLSPVAGG